ncbi:MAG: M3 family oligoendopeptidase [Microthrixaceae bacterium]
MTPPPDATTQRAPTRGAATAESPDAADHPTDPDLTDPDLTAAEVGWELDDLLAGSSVDELVAQATAVVEGVAAARGTVGDLDADGLAALMRRVGDLHDLLGRAGSYVGLRLAENTLDPERGAAMAKLAEASTELASQLVFLELEWAAVADEHADELLADPVLGFCAHHLRTMRRYRDHLLAEPQEQVLTETSVSGAAAWVRLFDEQTSAIEVALPDSAPGGARSASLEEGLSLLQHPDRPVRADAAEAVSEALRPGLRTRAFIFNTLLLDKSVHDRLRSYPTWLSSRNLANEASDESVAALIDAVVGRYDLPQRWYRLKAQVLGVERLADYDRSASVAESDRKVGWNEATGLVIDAYDSFSPQLADIVREFIDGRWVDAPVRPGKRPGAFCAYTVADHHPYLLLNWTASDRDVLTLAHELGHGIHAYLARPQGNFAQDTPLTMAETASVFGEAITNQRLLSRLEDPNERFALLASTLEDSIATVFRQVAMSRFESAVHTHRRDTGELSVDDFGDHWAATQTDMLGDAVELSEGYRNWWSYVPHFMATPGYVYAYAFGQLLALSVYARYQSEGEAFVPDYLAMLSAGGSRSPEDLAAMVDCDLTDPGFWDAGLDIVGGQLDAAEAAARDAGRLR